MERLLREVDGRSIPARETWWGYEVLQLVDPDGNELLVRLEKNLLPERREADDG